MTDFTPVLGEPQDLAKRGISSETCRKVGYITGVIRDDHPIAKKTPALAGQTSQIAQYYDAEGVLVGQKLRFAGKKFMTLGKIGEHLFGRRASPAGGKVLVITEGEIDALAYFEVRKNWPCVSIPTGAAGARKALEANLDYIESFQTVVLAFDNDEPGRKAVEECKGLLSPGKVRIAALDPRYKDYGEALDAGDYKAIPASVFNAEEVKLDGLVTVDEVLEEALKPTVMGLPWFIPELTELTFGRRWGEIYGLGGATGGGKTDIFTEQVAYDVATLGLDAGVLFLEQKPTETVKRIAGKIGNKRFHVPDDGWTPEELRSAASKLKGKVTFYDSFGETEWEGVKSRIRYMNKVMGIRLFYVDHLTAMADTADEKGSLEQIMKEMAGLANELSVIIHFISHLATPDGTPHEEGGRVTIRHFKGSRAIGFWSFLLIGLERNQQAEDLEERSTTTMRILKDRMTGQATGHTIFLGYDSTTGRIYPKSSANKTPASKASETF